MDNYILDDFHSDHHELQLSAADIDAIGSEFPSPVREHIPLAEEHQLHLDPQLQQEEQQLQQQQHEEQHHMDEHGQGVEQEHGQEYGHSEVVMQEDEEGEFLPDPHQDQQEQEDNMHEEGTGQEGASLMDGEMREMWMPGGDEAGPSSRRKSSGLTSEEKKRRMKDNNRKAAERSRAKKRQTLDSTEQQVTALRKENERLRARLTALQSNPGAIDNYPEPTPGLLLPRPPVPAPILDPEDIGIDRAYTLKLGYELLQAKSALLEKQIELEGIRGTPSPEEVILVRRQLVEKYASMSVLRAQEAAMTSVLGLLKGETTELGVRRAAIEGEVAKRGGPLGAAASGSGGDGHAVEVEEAGEEDRTQEEEAASHTQVLAQAVRDVAMGEARHLGAEHEGEGTGEKDVYDIQPYIEQAVKEWHEHQDIDQLGRIDIDGNPI